MDETAPRRVTLLPDARLAIVTASVSVQPSASFAARTPLKVSPAPVVSIGLSGDYTP